MVTSIAQQEIVTLGKATGMVTPQQAVDFARTNPESALHKCLEWDDSIAGEQYRLEQARRIIRSVTIKVENSGGKNVVVPLFVHDPGESSQGYVHTQSVTEEDRVRAILDAEFTRAIGCMRRAEAIAVVLNAEASIAHLRKRIAKVKKDLTTS